MSIPPEIQSIIDRLNLELEEIEREATEGLNLIRPILSSFPDNVILIQLFASLSNFLLFVEISERRIEITINRISSDDVANSIISEVGEDLGTELGRALEAKISVRRIISRLQELQ
ncbi:restriction endonuclease subunit S [Waterburya agarophytonicola K14]|uniref:Restriction endonuclease subunit S n=1 Tax=Waterburya agarophytonicola KI4 TaxID=2874699 RepID=A0A964BUI3_9CYAN|nr:restriction endonuclease subunit S [Waterburya agarophytonicola]MCC0178456.1 restriction endonuclease subunit S [Waterburya agarophytonicola KI4]